MADQYISELLRISIAQICQTIGYNAIQTTPLELLQDNLHKFLHEFCRDLRRHVEHYNRNEANLDDVCLTLASLNINVNELLEYILNVQPVTFAIDVPKFPVRKNSNLNFLKPGSREVLIRPVHIYEHLPPILPPDDYANESVYIGSGFVHHSCSSRMLSNSEDADVSHIVEVKSDHIVTNIDGSIFKQETDGNPDLKDAKNHSLTAFFKAKTNARMLDEEGRPTREIGSVMMTTGGFISPAIEGKLPDSRIPDIIDILEGLDAPPPPPPQRSFATSRSSSRTSVVTPTPTSTSAAQPNVGSEENSVALSNGPLEKSLTLETHTAQTKQNAATVSPGGIANATSSAITAAAAMRLAKKHVPVQQSALPPPLAARILKKAKKKSAMMPFSTSNKLGRSGFPNNSQDPSAASVDLTDKSQRKRMKMLQKLVKSAKSTSGEINNFSDSNGKIKNLHGLFNPTLIDSMPSGSKRLQMEKILKRQAKHKQKLLRAQMAIQLHDKPLEHLELQQQHQQQHKLALLESPKVPISKMISSAKHLPTFMPNIPHLIEKKNSKSPNNTGANAPSRKARKTSPTVTPNFLNSIPGYRSINSLKNASISAPVFGEAPFSNDQTYKELPEVKTPEVKLSTEPDRSKLNIFKKISSKQKMVQRSLSPTSDAPGATQIFSGNDNQVINLPSGTTITPAPPTSGRHVYAPDDGSFKTVPDSNKINNADDTNLTLTQSTTPPSLFGKTGIISETESPDGIHKPKKRGRKPGSKNQPKVPGAGLTPGVSPKKPKKIKIQKNLYGPPFQLHAEQRTEPLNLSHSFSSRSDMNSNIPLGIASTYPILDQSVLQKEVAERKKFKVKDASVPMPDGLIPQHLGMQQNSRESSKKSLISPFSAPTKEEVDSINRKLLKMDTVLQPAPPLHQLPMAQGPSSLGSKEMSISPTKNVLNSSPGSKHRSLLPRNSAGSFGLSGSPLEGTIPGPLKSFPNLPPNLVPMLPMYTFPPRPGLIPAPGLFPSMIGGFPNKQTNPTANMLLQGYLPFPGLKPSSSGLLRSPGMKITDKLDNVSMMEPSGAERNYCNVAPLVPESVKQKLSSPSTAGTSLISPKPNTAFGDRDTPKTPQLKLSPSSSESYRESLHLKFSGMITPDNRSLSSKSVPSTPGGISLSTFDSLMRSSSMSTNSSTPNNSIGVPDTLRSRALSHSSDNLKNIPNIPTLNMDSPIEVSDDSGEASPLTITSKSKSSSSSSGKHRSHLKPPSLPAPLLSHIDDLFIPIDNTKNIGLNQPFLLSARNKEVKKNKKQNKTTKSSHSMSPAASVEFCVSKIGSDSGVGKLAGGADLIPLSATGLAYSSKTTPTSSLTASTASSSYDVSNREFGSSEVLGGDLSVTPSSDAYDKRKKLKKIKFGKIKKKKDKKDKTKNKEKHSEKIEKRVKEKDPEKQRDKDALKKIKKDKKREKQRSTRESLSSPNSVTAPNNNLASTCFDMNTMNLSNIPAFPGTAAPINTASSSVVPKLTLKLGNCQSPTPFDDMKRKQTHKPTSGTQTAATTRESSPELARISPLVTRPPKQKSTSIDSSSHFNALGGVVSSGSNSLGTFTTTELFGDKNRSNNCMNLNISSSPIPPAPTSWSSGGTLSASSTLLPQQLLQSLITQHAHEEPSISASSTEVASSTTRSNSNIHSPALVHETNRPSSYIDAEGNRVWICPACGKVDDGSAMIGCDGCDAWYHWVCVGIFVAPKDNEDWFCRVCIAKKKGIHGIDKKRKRNKKNK